MTHRYDRLVNSTVAFVAALFLSVTLHEFAHGLTAWWLGATPTVFAGHEDHLPPLSAGREVVVALAGPGFSLLSGFLVLLLPRRGHGFGRLFALWFGVLSVQNCAGYLMTGPFVSVGDIGKALSLLSAPAGVYGGLFLLGAAGTIGLGRVLTSRLLTLTDATAPDRAAQLRQLAFFTWMAGVAVALLLSVSSDIFSRDGLFETAAVFAAGLPATMARFFMPQLSVEGVGFSGGMPWGGFALVAALTVARLTLLTRGIRL